MRTILLFLLLASCRCCFCQTDTNVLAVGDWSEPVRDSAGYTLRGRLLVYGAQGQNNLGFWGHARVYLELQHPHISGWYDTMEILYSIRDLHFEMRDWFDPIPQEPVDIGGPTLLPCWVTLPCDSTVRLRADEALLGSQSKPEGVEIFVANGRWVIRPSATNDFFLSATFSPGTNQSSVTSRLAQQHDPNYHLWQGTLKLPKVDIPPHTTTK
jgi:hypothetical protein